MLGVSDADFRAVQHSRAKLRERDKPKRGKEGNLQRVGAGPGRLGGYREFIQACRNWEGQSPERIQG